MQARAYASAPDGALQHLAQQLWGPALDTGQVRIHTGGPDADWTDVERYLALPTVASATMLLPSDDLAALLGSMSNFRRLRRSAPALQRRVLAAAARARVPLPFPTVRIQVAATAGPRRPVLPLEQLARTLGEERLYASIGVRTGANRKATLQLVDRAGQPRGFAKIAWNQESAEGIVREGDALSEHPGDATARAPGLLARGDFEGWPFIVTEPLPADCARLRTTAAPTAQQVFALTPISRRAPIADTGQFRALRDRVVALRGQGIDEHLTAATLSVLVTLAALTTQVPVVARWHGDFTPWNCARDSSGVLWCWDWESSEPDASAGLDSLHWALTSHTEAGERLSGSVLLQALNEATPALVAAGLAPEARYAVAALYAATLAERACTLSTGSGGWEEEWVLPDQLLDLLDTTHRLLADGAPARGGADR